MNPMYVYQYLLSQGVPSAQAMQMAMSMSGSLGTPGSSPTGAPATGGGMDDIYGLLMALAGRQGINAVQQPYQQQQQAANIGMNPALLTRRINALTQPMSQQLIKSVTRATNPGIAEAGLATSPGMSKQITAEALAPYELQEQQMGQNAAFEGLSLPGQVGTGAAGAYPSAGIDLVELMRMMNSGSP
jgi:hypothetical protein